VPTLARKEMGQNALFEGLKELRRLRGPRNKP